MGLNIDLNFLLPCGRQKKSVLHGNTVVHTIWVLHFFMFAIKIYRAEDTLHFQKSAKPSLNHSSFTSGVSLSDTDLADFTRFPPQTGQREKKRSKSFWVIVNPGRSLTNYHHMQKVFNLGKSVTVFWIRINKDKFKQDFPLPFISQTQFHFLVPKNSTTFPLLSGTGRWIIIES